MIRPTTPIGTFIRNSHGHVHHAKTKPPNTGPNAGARETTIPRIDITRPSLSGPTACPRMVCPAGIKTPADRPCATRRTMSSSIFHAIAHRPEVTVKTDNAMSHKRPGPNVWLSHAHDGNETASASKYPLETHWTRSRLDSRSVAMVSRPIFASEASIPAANAPNTMIHARRHTGQPMSGVVAYDVCPADAICRETRARIAVIWLLPSRCGGDAMNAAPSSNRRFLPACVPESDRGTRRA